MNKNDVAQEIAKKLKRVHQDLSLTATHWRGNLGLPSANDQMAIDNAAEYLSNIKETLEMATGKRTLFKAALNSLDEMFLDESSTRADVEEACECIEAAIHTLKGGI